MFSHDTFTTPNLYVHALIQFLLVQCPFTFPATACIALLGHTFFTKQNIRRPCVLYLTYQFREPYSFLFKYCLARPTHYNTKINENFCRPQSFNNYIFISSLNLYARLQQTKKFISNKDFEKITDLCLKNMIDFYTTATQYTTFSRIHGD